MIFVFQLPPPQLENALNRTAALKAPLVAHASQQNIRASLPRFTWRIIFFVGYKRLKDILYKGPLFCFWSPFPPLSVFLLGYAVSRSVLAVLGLSPDSQSSSQAQTSQAHTGDTSNSEKDALAEKSKESSSASWSSRNWILQKLLLKGDIATSLPAMGPQAPESDFRSMM